MNTEQIIQWEIEAIEEAIVSNAIELNSNNTGKEIWDILSKVPKRDKGYYIGSYLTEAQKSPQGGFVELYDSTILLPYGEIEIEKAEYEQLPEEEKSDWHLSDNKFAYMELQAVQWFFSDGRIKELEKEVMQAFPQEYEWAEILGPIQMPCWALPYLVNNDPSGLTEEEIEQVDNWVERNQDENGRATQFLQFRADYDKASFVNRPEFGLASDCEEYHIFISEEKTN